MAQPSQASGYAHEDAWDSGWLRVDSTHELYYEQYGKRDGRPALYLHGGPGGHTTKANTAFFDPAVYRVVLLDQRGCGRSRPNAETRANTTWDLVADLERLRNHLLLPGPWHLVFGGSWGSTLALAYAQAHPAAVGALVLRGVFAMRRLELDWTLARGGGASLVFPDAFADFLAHVHDGGPGGSGSEGEGEGEKDDHVAAYCRRLMSDDEAVCLPAARAWNRWEISISTLRPNVEGLRQLDDASYLLAHARIEAHYFTHGAWLRDGQLLEPASVDKIRHIPSKFCLILESLVLLFRRRKRGQNTGDSPEEICIYVHIHISHPWN